MGGLGGMQLGPRAEARVGEPHAFKPLDIPFIYRCALALEEGPLVPVEAQPAQVVEKGLDGAGGGLAGVEVFDAQGERAMFGTHGKPGHECAPDVSQVHAA